MNSTLSILGLAHVDSKLFDGLRNVIEESVIVDGEELNTLKTYALKYAQMNLGNATNLFDDITDEILTECAELEVVYAEPLFMKEAIRRWANREHSTWNRLAKSIMLEDEFNPLENYDRYETAVDSRSVIGSSADKSNNVSTMKNDIAAFDSDTLKTNSVQTSQNNIRDTKETIHMRTQQADGTYAVDAPQGNSFMRSDTQDDNVHGAHIHGNIGVTTATQMIEEYRESVQFRLIDYIVDSFKKKFCLLVY